MTEKSEAVLKNTLLLKSLTTVPRHASFTGFLIAVLFICRKVIVVIFVHRGVGPSLFRDCSCAGARSNTQQPASARLSQ
jgi:hypothetical protein